MDVRAPTCEFGLELAFVVGHCYALLLNGTLRSTTSLPGMEDFYFFSPSHFIDKETSVPLTRRLCVPVDISGLDAQTFACASARKPLKLVWTPPPFKERFGGQGLSFWLQFCLYKHTDPARPLLLLHNKVCDEWGRGSVHRIPDWCLKSLVCQLTRRFQVVYCRPLGTEEGFSEDHNTIDRSAADLRLAEEAGAVLLQTVMRTMQQPFNRTQLYLHAACSRFISVQGGNSVLASFFGGINLVYAREGVELRNQLYTSLFPALSGADIRVVSSLSDLEEQASRL